MKVRVRFFLEGMHFDGIYEGPSVSRVLADVRDRLEMSKTKWFVTRDEQTSMERSFLVARLVLLEGSEV